MNDFFIFFRHHYKNKEHRSDFVYERTTINRNKSLYVMLDGNYLNYSDNVDIAKDLKYFSHARKKSYLFPLFSC